MAWYILGALLLGVVLIVLVITSYDRIAMTWPLIISVWLLAITALVVLKPPDPH